MAIQRNLRGPFSSSSPSSQANSGAVRTAERGGGIHQMLKNDVGIVVEYVRHRSIGVGTAILPHVPLSERKRAVRKQVSKFHPRIGGFTQIGEYDFGIERLTLKTLRGPIQFRTLQASRETVCQLHAVPYPDSVKHRVQHILYDLLG